MRVCLYQRIPVLLFLPSLFLITESAAPGSRFPLESAQDQDVGTNSLRSYQLSSNEHFVLNIQTRNDGSKFAELVLETPLDREQQKMQEMVLTSVDGGSPERSGTALITITVLDANDNVPVFDQSVYRASLVENAPRGTLVLKLNATDLDEGPNADITYSFTLYTSEKTQYVFALNPNTGEITVKGTIDYEDMKFYEMHVEAKDKGQHPLLGQCKIVVDVTDTNDNYPEITVKSYKSTVNENIPVGTVIAIVGISDRDTGDNGKVNLSINQQVPFWYLSVYDSLPIHLMRKCLFSSSFNGRDFWGHRVNRPTF
uniref:Cadherin domain-containing protein n=1 Tax=Hucho hucho TaxID=62062 RepID=A0A4W5RQ71_9TELE